VASLRKKQVLRSAQDDRRGTRRRRELERGVRKGKKQVPPAGRRARNDSLLGWRGVGALQVRWKKRMRKSRAPFAPQGK
jgi:hypothetical protein